MGMFNTATANKEVMADPDPRALLEWYDQNARTLPWRIPPAQSKAGVKPDPYHVWLSEIMLQQTQVATVREYYEKFLSRWPTVTRLAAADVDDVMAAWAGLGYYSRARNLKQCAEQVTHEFGGAFPETAAALKQLPGIGDYTAAAIAAIAFGEPVAVIDGNIERVVSRLYRIATPLPAARADIRRHLDEMIPPGRPGDFAQALMDLGAAICKPRNPVCERCPLQPGCAARAHGDMERFPVKAAKKPKPTRKGAAFVIENSSGHILLERRAKSGLLGGMSAPPTTAWNSRQDGATGKRALPFDADWSLKGEVRHTFTHFHLRLEVWHAVSEAPPDHDGWWAPVDRLDGEALPKVFRKVLERALA